MRLRISVDQDLCGCTGYCEMIAPDVFSLTDSAQPASVRMDVVSDEELGTLVREAESTCPTGAITVADDPIRP